MESEELFATDLRYFSDSAELSYAAQLIAGEALRAIDDHTFHENILRQFSAWVESRISDGHMVFACSFSEDGNMLSQWRSYCPDGLGVSLGFEALTLTSISRPRNYSLVKCLYRFEDQKAIAKTIVTEILNQALAYEPSELSHPTQNYYPVFVALEFSILRIAAIMKHPSFHEEKEWRLVSEVLTNYVNEDISHRVGKSMLLPYQKLEFPVRKRKTHAFERVILGPTPNRNPSMSSLSRYLSRAGASPKHGVGYCQIPYRTW